MEKTGPAPAYDNGQPMQQPTVVPGTVPQYNTAIPLNQLQDHPAPVDCPACGQRALTSTQFKSGNTTNAWALGLCIFTCCCCIPYMLKSMKDVEHRCGNCGTGLATWHRSGRTVVSYSAPAV